MKVGGASLPTLAPGGFETKSAPEGRRLLKLYSAYRSWDLLKMQIVIQQVWKGLQMLLVLDHALNGKGSRDRRAHSGRREDLGGGGGEFRWEPEFVVAKAGHIWQTSLLGTVDDLLDFAHWHTALQLSYASRGRGVGLFTAGGFALEFPATGWHLEQDDASFRGAAPCFAGHSAPLALPTRCQQQPPRLLEHLEKQMPPKGRQCGGPVGSHRGVRGPCRGRGPWPSRHVPRGGRRAWHRVSAWSVRVV